MNGAVLIHKHIMGGDGNGNAGDADTAEGLVALFADVELAEAAKREIEDELRRVRAILEPMRTIEGVPMLVRGSRVTADGDLEVWSRSTPRERFAYVRIGVANSLARWLTGYDVSKAIDLEIVEMEIQGMRE